MKYALLLLTIFLTIPSTWALDSFSIHHFLGTKGELGQESLQLVCVKKECLITSSHNNDILEKKTLSSDAAKKIFKLAREALKEANKTSPPDKSNVIFNLDNEGIELKSSKATADLLSLELKLKQSLRP